MNFTKKLKYGSLALLRLFGLKISKHLLLEFAKDYLLESERKGMCECINKSLIFFDVNTIYDNDELFPMFNPDFCEVNYRSRPSYNTYWWYRDDKESRIKAFEKLINYYKQHKEYI